MIESLFNRNGRNFFSFRFYIRLYAIDVDRFGARKILQCWLYSFLFAADTHTSVNFSNNTQLKDLHFNLQLPNANLTMRTMRKFGIVVQYSILPIFLVEKPIILSLLYVHVWQWTGRITIALLSCIGQKTFTWVIVVFWRK